MEGNYMASELYELDTWTGRFYKPFVTDMRQTNTQFYIKLSYNYSKATTNIQCKYRSRQTKG